MQAFVYWSIYVRTASVKKLKDEHLPPIVAALENTPSEFDIHKEAENPGLLRAVTYQNIEAAAVLDVVGVVLRRAYRLADGWRIHGLSDLDRGDIRHVMGGWGISSPKSRPPALESMMFEIEPGSISREAHGSWRIDGTEHTRVVP